MRNFSKTLISMAAVMAVGSAMAAGAMAETLTASYAGDKVTFSGVTEGKSQYTLLVVEGTKAEDAAEYTYNATETTIKQIDQNDAGVAFTEAVVGTLADGSYKVLVGNNDGTVDEGIFTVGEKEPEFETETIVLGNVNTNAILDAGDVLFVKRKAANKNRTDGVGNAGMEREKVDGTKIVLGNVNTNAILDAGDVLFVKRKAANKNRTDGVGNAGQTVEVKVIK